VVFQSTGERYAIRQPKRIPEMSRDELEAEVRLWRGENPPVTNPRCVKPCVPVGCRLDDNHEGACVPYA
jgi:hypothetical protein